MLREPAGERAFRRPRVLRSKKTRHAAVLVDFEHIYNNMAHATAAEPTEEQAGDFDTLDDAVELLSALRGRLRERYSAVMAIGRSYADFDRIGGDAQSQLQLLAFEPRFMLGTEQKSSADILLSIDAIEMLLTRPELETFIIVGGNRTYLPVVRRIREHMKRVLLVGFEKSTSGDLLQVVGKENFIDAESLIPEHASPAPREGNGQSPEVVRPISPSGGEETTAIDMEALASETTSDDLPGEPSDEETLEVCMEELLAAYYQYGGKTVWLTPFLRMLNERFPYLDNRGRKRLVEDLQARKAIRIEKVEGDPYPYSVVEINWESDWVAGLDEARGNN